MKNMKKLLSTVLTFALVLSMNTVAFAEDAKQNQDASFTKKYTVKNANTTSPEETFTFKFTADSISDSNENLGKADMPAIPDATITFAEIEASADGTVQSKDVEVALKDVTWPGVGIYIYNVNEVAGDTLGVKYDETTAKLKVTVAYDKGTDTYYTAFVTLNLADEDQNGITDSKIGGFENTYSAGSLSVKKKVEGNLADTTKEFKVNVTFENSTGKEVKSVISYVEDSVPKTISTEAWNDNKAEVVIELRDDETITFTNIPYGITYTVKEQDYTTVEQGGYEAAEYDTNKTGTISEGNVSTVITNRKGVVVDTGIVMDSVPYVVLLAVVCVGFFGFVSKKRTMEEM